MRQVFLALSTQKFTYLQKRFTQYKATLRAKIKQQVYNAEIGQKSQARSEDLIVVHGTETLQ